MHAQHRAADNERELLHYRYGALLEAAFATKARGWSGVAAKLAIWRREIEDSGNLDTLDQPLVYSVYLDVLRLAGRDDLRHPSDPPPSAPADTRWFEAAVRSGAGAPTRRSKRNPS